MHADTLTKIGAEAGQLSRPAPKRSIPESPRPRLSVIIPASNEAGWIAACLTALLTSDPTSTPKQAIVVANGCRDDTAAVARGLAGLAQTHGWELIVIERTEGNKAGALNAGDAAANGDIRVYLDADVHVSPALMRQLIETLCVEAPVYASGTAVIPQPQSTLTRAYARFWQRLPFARSTAPGYGLFAVNAAGRRRWGEFPAIISDDTFVRLQFAPGERRQCAATYEWPMIEGFDALVRVRRRQDQGVQELNALIPELVASNSSRPPSLGEVMGAALRDPLGFAAYAAVALAVRTRKNGQAWVRGR
jgi:glycosyltransferase involved in cell wall biosynthesis